MAFTKEQVAQYLEDGGNHCPYCASKDVSAGAFDGEGLCQTVECQACGRKWLDVYKLVSIEPVEG